MTSGAAEEVRWQRASTLIWLVRLSVGTLVKLTPASTAYRPQMQQAWREQLLPPGQRPEFDPDAPF